MATKVTAAGVKPPDGIPRCPELKEQELYLDTNLELPQHKTVVEGRTSPAI